MCLFHPSNRHARRLISLGIACMASAVLLQSLSPALGLPSAVLHFLLGVVIGIWIAANIAALRQNARCGGNAESGAETQRVLR